MNESSEVVPSISLTDLFRERDEVTRCLQCAFEQLGRAETIWKQRLVRSFKACLGGERYEFKQYEMLDDPEGVIKRVDAAYWDALMGGSGLRTYMSASKREQWKRQIDTADVAPFTQENVQQTFKDLVHVREDLLDEAILELFQSLSWDFAANSPLKFKRRFVLSHFAGYDFCCLNTSSTNALDDLNRALHVLDGKTYPDHRQGMFKTLDPLFCRGQSGRWAGTYFELKWYKTSNACHVTFLRPDLIDRLNKRMARAAGKVLPRPQHPPRTSQRS